MKFLVSSKLPKSQPNFRHISAKNLSKSVTNLVGFLGDLKTPKIHTYAAHFNVLKKYLIILKMCFSVNQIDDLPSSNKK